MKHTTALPPHPLVSYKRPVRVTNYRPRTAKKHISYKEVFYISMSIAILWLMSLKFTYDFVEGIKAEAAAPLLSPLGKPLPTPQPVTLKTLETATKTEKTEILAYLVEKFGDHAADMITIVNKCENHKFDQKAVNYNRNGTEDYGILQINSIHIPKCGEDIKTSWKANIDCGYKIFTDAGNSFSPWSCSHVVGVKSFWQ